MQLRSRRSHFSGWPADARPGIYAVTTNPMLPAPVARQRLLLLDSSRDAPALAESPYRGLLLRSVFSEALPSRAIVLEPALGHLADGDIVRVDPQREELRVLFRPSAPQNSLLVTERCNSFCLMCSQPPRDIDDSSLVDEIRRTIELIPRDTPTLGLTGGEPTLAGEGFFDIVRHARNYLPDTELHVLTNGRRFAEQALAARLGALHHPGLRLGIPLYSEQPDLHDFVVQARGAFDETVKGLLNLAAEGIRIELRVVIHRHTYGRLAELARFIARNLPFVEHVALMGLELIGFAKVNLGNLWVDPYDYGPQLVQAVRTLERGGVQAVIYNHQLCVVPESVRSRCVRSISDWKNDYLPECDDCALKAQCGGFFSSGLGLAAHSAHIAPFRHSGLIA